MDFSVVLVLDSELGFVLALAQELLSRDFTVLPARTTREARSMLKQFRLYPDALIMNCGIAGACKFATGVTRAHPDVQAIGIVSGRGACKNCADVLKARFRDPEDRAPRQIPNCADVIRRLVIEQRRRTRRTGRA